MPLEVLSAFPISDTGTIIRCFTSTLGPVYLWGRVFKPLLYILMEKIGKIRGENWGENRERFVENRKTIRNLLVRGKDNFSSLIVIGFRCRCFATKTGLSLITV